MKVYRSLTELREYKDSVVTVGNFDGVHSGHLNIIERVVHKARKCNCRSVIITFSPHPQIVKSKGESSFSLLTPIEEKIRFLKNTGIDILLVLPFDKNLSRMKAEDFIVKIIKDKIGAKYIIIGFNHSFGNQRSGDIKLLQQLSDDFDFAVELIEPHKVDEIIVSSTKIRELLNKGNIKLANKMLGRYYTLKGKVIDGKKFGQHIGFPTANIIIENERKLIPQDGVYVALASDNNLKREGTVYIGKRPTVGGKKRMIEVYLHDYSGDLYGHLLQVEFLDFIRKESKFCSIEELKKSIKNDIDITKNILSISRRQ
ncbi:MAG: bifunctional riboflavin kinase/FAD synthetase [bacterium]